MTPPGKTRADALARAIQIRKELWSRSDWMRVSEDRRLTELERACLGLVGGDKDEARRLMQAAIWGG